jgi:hypothetical protein
MPRGQRVARACEQPLHWLVSSVPEQLSKEKIAGAVVVVVVVKDGAA